MTKFWMICWSYKYNWCLCRFIGKLYILLLTFLMNLSEICITLHEFSWSRIKWLWNPAMYHSVRLTTFLWFLYQLFSKIDETGVSCCSPVRMVSTFSTVKVSFLCVFLAFDSVLLGHSVFSSPATTTNDLRLWRISIPDLIHYIF